ncbi:MAG: hypothetical protein IT441_07210 [Phycisphaeraceae bacterium]|nr:hypothetical protein [Phycisphaeraceae bacterium]
MTANTHAQDSPHPLHRLHVALAAWRTSELLMLALALAGLALTIYLSLVSTGLVKLLGCSSGSCTKLVMSTAWSRFLGLPVTLLAVIVYAAVVVSIPLTRPGRPTARRRIAWSVLIACSLALGLAAIWFVSLMMFELRRSCGHCAATHLIGLLLLHLVLAAAPLGQPAPNDPAQFRLRPLTLLPLFLLAALAVGVLILGQTYMPTPPAALP